MNILRVHSEMRSGKSIFDLPLRATLLHQADKVKAQLDLHRRVYRRGHQWDKPVSGIMGAILCATTR